MMQTINVTLNSVHTMLMNSNLGVNPTIPLVKELKEITGKRKKTDEDNLKILEIKWKLALYYDENIGVYIPAANIEASIREAAKRSRRGKDVVTGIHVPDDYIPLKYDGPKTIDELWNDGRFRDIRVGRIQKASVMICRPRFAHWSVNFDMVFDDEIFSEDEIKELLITAGKYTGLCDYRPRYGTFEPVIHT